MDAVRKLILEKLDELGLKMSEGSKKIGRNHAFLQQFLKRGIPAELSERDRKKLAELLQLSEDDLRGPSTSLPKRSYEKKVNASRANNVDGDSPPPYVGNSADNTPVRIVPGSELFGSATDLPVFGTTQDTKEGAVIISERAVDWVARPSVLLRVADGYGLIVSRDTMAPAIRSGSTALVNPHLPPRVDDVCVFRCSDERGATRAVVKEYRGQTETHWKVRQYNPPREFTLKKADWHACHRIVGNYAP